VERGASLCWSLGRGREGARREEAWLGTVVETNADMACSER